MDSTERFWSKVQKTATCWYWMGNVSWRGYGRFYLNGKNVQAHRFSFYGEEMSGPDLDHLCRVRRCVNPEHLEPVTNRENLLRSPLTLPSVALAKTECPKGHPLTPENVYVRGGNQSGQRRCRTCTQEAMRANYARHAEARRAYARSYRLAAIDGETT